jgi:hypothetical protein
MDGTVSQDALNPNEESLPPPQSPPPSGTPPAGRRARNLTFWAGVYWLYTAVVSVAVIPFLIAEPGEGSFSVLVLLATPVFVVAVIRVIARFDRRAMSAFVIALSLTIVGPAVAVSPRDISDARLAVAAVSWALVCLALSAVLAWRTRGPRADAQAVSGLGRGALLGLHVGTIAVGVVVSGQLATRGPEVPGFLFGPQYPKHGDWRLAIPFAVAALIAFCGALAVDTLSREVSARALRFLACGALLIPAAIGFVLALGLGVGWWRVFPAAGQDSDAAIVVLPFYILGVVAIAFDWNVARFAASNRM